MSKDRSECAKCEYPDLCLVMLRTADDYIAPDGKLRQIIGCCGDTIYIHGDLLTQKDIAEIKRKLGSGASVG